jgi:hypothetical protein
MSWREKCSRDEHLFNKAVLYYWKLPISGFSLS